MRNADTRRYDKLIEDYKQKWLKAKDWKQRENLRHEFCNRKEFKAFTKEEILSECWDKVVS